MPTCRCSHMILDSETKRMRKCKIKKTYLISEVQHCHIHATIMYGKNINTIQRCYRGYVIRKKTIMFKKLLPRELQVKIIGYMRQLTINERITRVITKKTNSFITKYNLLLQIPIFRDAIVNYADDDIFPTNNFFSRLKHLRDLIDKYDCIVLYTNNTTKFLDLWLKYRSRILFMRHRLDIVFGNL